MAIVSTLPPSTPLIVLPPIVGLILDKRLFGPCRYGLASRRIDNHGLFGHRTDGGVLRQVRLTRSSPCRPITEVRPGEGKIALESCFERPLIRWI